ncbi:MAG TPA: hypothetical protein VN224_14835, partial [Xanthomonadales bacterium]|nr:hypothetical protein [Xanthomonadales bacterium]
MRGPNDPPIDAVKPLTARPGVAASVTAEAPPTAVAGGKALLRLFETLQRRGLASLADDSVAAALPDSARDAYASHAERFSAAPEAPLAAADGGGALETMSAELLAVGQQTGAPTGTGPQWRSIGPTTIPNGQTYGSSRVNVSGRIAAIAVDPGNASHVLVGAANGGVWESRDHGATWAPRTDFAATTAVGAIVFDPHNPSIVYCGTGEGNWWAWLGAGILRSNDGGASWNTLCTSPFVGQGFYDLRVDPGNSNHMLAATTGGLYVSSDAGVTWAQRRNVKTWSISIAPAGGAGAEILAASSDGLFRSTDGGTTWTAVALPGSPGSFNRLAVSIAPSNP